MQRVVAWGDGWIPVANFGPHTFGQTPEQLKERHRVLLEMAARAGRDPESIQMSVFVQEHPSGEMMERVEGAGVDRAVITLSGSSTEDTEAQLEILAGEVL